MNSLSDIRAALGGLPGGAPAGVAVDYVAAVDSTSSELKRRLAAGALAGTTVLVTDHQTAGRGTHGRSWTQRAGRDLALSIATSDSRSETADPRLPLAVGAAAALALEACIDNPQAERGWVGLRWPNDLCVGDPPRKFGGLLLERSRGWVVIGIGLNVNSAADDLGAALAGKATTLSEYLEEQLDRCRLAACFIAQLLDILGLIGPGSPGLPLEQLLAGWPGRDCTGGKEYRLASTGERIVAESVDTVTGELLCRSETGRPVRITSYRELAES